ncbi:MAG: M48 family metalloprotease [Phycisphaeraceae bacterium]
MNTNTLFRTALRRGSLAAIVALALATAGCSTIEKVGNTIGGTVGRAVSGAARVVSAGQQAYESGQFDSKDEYHVGRAAAAQLIQQYGLFKDDQAVAYLNLVGHTLVTFSDSRAQYAGYHFAVLNSNEVNAFACPGAFIFVTRGMLRLAATEDELAAVLAHEIAHINGRHAVKSIDDSRFKDFLAVMLKEGARQVNAGQLADIGVQMTGDVVKTLTVAGYSRELESEADTKGVAILRDTGYDPNAMIALLTKMDQTLTPSSAGFGKTHPDTKDRIADARKAVGSTLPKPTVRERQARFDRSLALSRSK